MVNMGTASDVKVCPRCSNTLAVTDRHCRNCGYAPPDGTQTVTLKVEPLALRARRKEWTVDSASGSLTLHIRGMNQRIPLERVKQLVVGRVDVESGFTPDLDLSPFGAVDRGVSRTHLILHYQNNRLFATDLGSANGTFINGQRLIPDQSYEVHDRDELILGRLGVNVRISLNDDGSAEAADRLI
ncbi:MAG: FHA domain-containing protein [Anaerolineae bacterium]|nr:FHA domain-containing protein [Anaerolineae bacterium]